MPRTKDGFAVRRLRRRSWFDADRSIFGDGAKAAGLNSDALLVYLALLARADHHDGSCYPGVRTIAHDTRLSPPTVLKAIDRLATAGWIEVVKGDNGTRQTYFVDPSPVDGVGELVPEPCNAVERYQNGTVQPRERDRATALHGPCNGVAHNTDIENNVTDAPPVLTTNAPAHVEPNTGATANTAGAEPSDVGAKHKALRRLPAEYVSPKGVVVPAAPPPKAADVAWWSANNRDMMFSLLMNEYPHEHERHRAQMATARQWWRENDPDAEQVFAIAQCIERARRCKKWKEDGGRFIVGFGNFLSRAEYREFADETARAMLKGL